MVADAVIYHPTVAHYLRFVATTVGRDKLLRTIQYFSRFYAWYLFRTNNPQSSITPWEQTKKQLGLTRKILRVGKFVEHLKAASTFADAKAVDPISKYLSVARQLGYAGYLSLDTLTVLDAANIRKWDKAKTLQTEAYRFWLMGLTASAVSGLYSLYNLRQRRAVVDRKEGEGVVESKKIDREWNKAVLQLVTDLADMTSPATALGFASFDDGFIGLAGTLSSLIGMYNAWEKVRQ